MHVSTLFYLTIIGTTAAQTLKIPTRVGNIVHLPTPSVISSVQDMGNREFDRGRPCDNDKDNGSHAAVFILEDGATLANAIIGGDALEGVHCRGACTLRNVWFRDVCEDAISILGKGNALIEGGGAQNAIDKVVQHNGRGTVTIRNFTVVNAGKLYRSCGDCTNNSGPRNVIIQNVMANNVAELIGVNSNYGDVATISGTCGTKVKRVCAEWKGVKKGSGKSMKVSTTIKCKGQFSLSACDSSKDTEDKKGGSDDEQEPKKGGSDDEQEPKKEGSDDEQEPKKGGSDDEQEPKQEGSDDEQEPKKEGSDDEQEPKKSKKSKKSKKGSSDDEQESKKGGSEGEQESRKGGGDDGDDDEEESNKKLKKSKSKRHVRRNF